MNIENNNIIRELHVILEDWEIEQFERLIHLDYECGDLSLSEKNERDYLRQEIGYRLENLYFARKYDKPKSK